MDNKENKFILAEYKLYSLESNGELELLEETTKDDPFQFISGFGFTLDEFEKVMLSLNVGEKFDFTLEPEKAFGLYDENNVHEEPKESFMINGHFDHEHVYEDAVILMQDPNGKMYNALVMEINDKYVILNTNHPFAGMTLRFKGELIEKRDPTKEEIQRIINILAGENCCCGHNEHEEDCCCGHHEHNGECCHGHNHENGKECHKHNHH